MTLNEADSLFATPARLKAVESLLGDRKLRRISFSGLAGSAPAMLFASLRNLKKPILVVADDITEAGYVYNDIRTVAGEAAVAVFPSGYKRDIKYGQIDRRRRYCGLIRSTVSRLRAT